MFGSKVPYGAGQLKVDVEILVFGVYKIKWLQLHRSTSHHAQTRSNLRKSTVEVSVFGVSRNQWLLREVHTIDSTVLITSLARRNFESS